MKIAVMGYPAIGGGYTNYSFLKENLKHFNFSLISVGAIAQNDEVFIEPTFVHLGRNLDRKKDEKKLAFTLREYLHENNYDVFIPMNSRHAISIVPHLNTRIKIIHRVNGDSPRVYSYVTSYINHTNAIICNSKKQLEEVRKHLRGSSFNKYVFLIPHGVSPAGPLQHKKDTAKIRIGFLGRMHQAHKNIFIIPEILKHLEFDFELELIGSGENKNELLGKLDKEQIAYSDLGTIPNKNLNQYLKNWDILLFPSFEEGFGYTLLECMNNGVVPIANRLSGVTDYIIENAMDGFIIDNNLIEDYVEKLNLLQNDRFLLNKMKARAKSKVESDFNSNLIIKNYEKVIVEVVAKDSRKRESLELSSWKPYKDYKPTLFNRIKNFLENKV